jgi:hypothetical protein
MLVKLCGNDKYNCIKSNNEDYASRPLGGCLLYTNIRRQLEGRFEEKPVANAL